MNNEVIISNDNYLYKIVGMGNANWAFIQPDNKVYFVNNASSLFDEMEFETTTQALTELRKNGFGGDDDYLKGYRSNTPLTPPPPPYILHQNPIYSSGEYWY